jgi:hypothetical protein
MARALTWLPGRHSFSQRLHILNSRLALFARKHLYQFRILDSRFGRNYRLIDAELKTTYSLESLNDAR